MASSSTARHESGIVRRSATYDALGHVFAVECDDEPLLCLVEEAFAALAVAPPADRIYTVERRDGWFDLCWMGDLVSAGADRAGVLAWLQWDVNRRAVAAADADLVLHAGCVARDGFAVLVSGASGCGKSTLVAALLAQGCQYVTDEAVPVDLGAGHIRAYPRPMALDDHSLDLLPEIAPLRVAMDAVRHKRVVPLRAPQFARDDAPPQVALILFPERDASGLTVLDPVSRGEAIVRLAENAFNFPSHGRDGIDALALLAQHAESYRVVGDDPRAAANAVIDVLEQVPSHPGQGWRKVS